ncbi:PWWP domain-containing DNA repair factor 3A isoform X3 [Mus caroli]|uniref:PWWP domain-containing DNA repair factor 3A isoform X3 n=1 Tax=Mus caroli TaxID=10089 RepID=A0A6P7RSR1_MUSCR|nr:PWWP domain-containing DNA repair factor 3A isoform X3 [Mus caroli]
MTDAKYVLCRWGKRLWPAKVLARTETSAKNKRKKEFFLDVQILSLKEKIQVKSSAVEALQKSHIENIAAFLASQNEVPATPLEELTYRRSLRVALDVLNERTSLSPESHPIEDGTTLSQKEETDADVASQVSSAPSPSLLGEDGQAVVTQCASKRRSECSPKSLLPSSAFEDHLRDEESCAGVKGCDWVKSSGNIRPLTASERSRGCPTKRPRFDGGQNPPTRQQGTRTVGAAPCPRSCSGEATMLCSAGERDKPEEADPVSSEESTGFKSTHSLLEEEEEEEEEPPRILLYHEPRSFEVGMLVWLKYQKYPFWPAVVKSVRRRDKKASVLFIEGNMNPKGRGITVSLRRLKHFDCKEKHALLDRAKEDFAQAIGWCVSLITDYRVRLGCGSFAGSFLEYYAADISYPVRKSIQQDVLGTRFPQLGKGDPEEPVGDSQLGQWRPCRKVLPDRSRAARDRANQKLVEYIVKAKGAESHLRAILHSRKPSRWLKTFLSSSQCVTCMETYLEDEAQLDEVVEYLQGVCRDMDGQVPERGSGDRIRFILDVLLPEAIICAISAVEAVDYKTAEQKYIRGPTLSYREKEIFDNELLEERNRRRR